MSSRRPDQARTGLTIYKPVSLRPQQLGENRPIMCEPRAAADVQRVCRALVLSAASAMPGATVGASRYWAWKWNVTHDAQAPPRSPGARKKRLGLVHIEKVGPLCRPRVQSERKVHGGFRLAGEPASPTNTIFFCFAKNSSAICTERQKISRIITSVSMKLMVG